MRPSCAGSTACTCASWPCPSSRAGCARISTPPSPRPHSTWTAPDASRTPSRSAARKSRPSRTSGRYRASCSTSPIPDPAARERWLDPKGRELLGQARAALAELDTFDEPAVAAALEGLVERLAVKPREVYQPLRVAIAGGTISPGIFESVALLGREQTLRRIDRALAAG